MNWKARIESTCCNVSTDLCNTTCNLVCNGDFETIVPYFSVGFPDTPAEIQEGQLIFHASCWNKFRATNTPDIFSTTVPQGACTPFGIYRPVGIPDNFNGQGISPNTQFSSLTNTQYAGFSINEVAWTKLTAPLDPQYSYILTFSIRASNCPYGDPSLQGIGRITASLYNYVFDIISPPMVSEVFQEYFQTYPNVNPWFRRVFCLDFANNAIPASTLSNYTHVRIDGSGGLAESYIDDIAIYRLADAGCDKTICAGETVTIGKSCSIPGATYSWSPATEIISYPCGNSNCSEAVVRPTSTATFTLSVNAPNDEQQDLVNSGLGLNELVPNSCTATDQVTVTVKPSPQLTLVPPLAACEGSTICTSTVQANTTYSWSGPEYVTFSNPNGYCTDINWNSVNGGVITLSATGSNGCTSEASVTIEPCCEGTLATLMNKKATDLLNDFNTTTPTVKSEYLSFVNIAPFSGGYQTNNPNRIKMTINAPSGTISIVGTFTIDVGTLVIDNSELVFSQCGALMFEYNSAQNYLEIKNNSYLHACDDELWSGILINGGIAALEQIYMNGSRIEDAIQAVSLTGKYVRGIFVNNTFNKNVIHLDFKVASNLSTSSVSGGNKFLSNAGSPPVFNGAIEERHATTSCEDPNAIFYGYITDYAIRLRNSNKLAIDGNWFEHAYTGIYSERSNFTATNNVFESIFQSYAPVSGPAFNGSLVPSSGVGIFYSNSLRQGSVQGGYLTVSANTFKSLHKGVYVSNSPNFLGSIQTNVLIDHNTFDNTAVQGTSSDVAVLLEGVRCGGFLAYNSGFSITLYERLLIEDNVIVNMRNGILAKNTAGTLTIARNTINSINQTIKRLLNTGIKLDKHNSTTPLQFGSYVYSGYTTNYSINTNTLGSTISTLMNPSRGGILLNNSGGGSVSSNKIYMNDINLNTYGIASLFSAGVTISGNNPIQRITTNTSTSGTQANNNAGVLIESSFNNTVSENTMEDFVSGMVISKISSNLTILCNNFNNSRFTGVRINKADFGNQGYNSGGSSGSFTNGNKWQDYNASTDKKRIQGFLGTTNTHLWYDLDETIYPLEALNVNAASSTNVRVNSPTGYGTFSTYLLNSAGNCGLDFAPSNPEFGVAKRVSERDSLFGSVVFTINPDTLSDTTSTYIYTLTRRVFEELVADTSWLHTGDATDSSYQHFVAKCQTLPMGKQVEFWRMLNTSAIDSLVLDSLYSLHSSADSLLQDSLVTADVRTLELARINKAKSLNDKLVTAHPVEEVYKTAYSVFASRWAKGLYSLTSNDSAALNAIAFTSPWENGDGVYIARMLLDTFVTESDPELRIGMSEEKQIAEKRITLYPNPTDHSFNIQLEGVTVYPIDVLVYDLMGRTVLRKQQVSALQQYSLDGLRSGTYLYELRNSEGVLQRGKLLLSRH
jgi:hypothetical protein